MRLSSAGIAVGQTMVKSINHRLTTAYYWFILLPVYLSEICGGCHRCRSGTKQRWKRRKENSKLLDNLYCTEVQWPIIHRRGIATSPDYAISGAQPWINIDRQDLGRTFHLLSVLENKRSFHWCVAGWKTRACCCRGASSVQKHRRIYIQTCQGCLTWNVELCTCWGCVDISLVRIARTSK